MQRRLILRTEAAFHSARAQPSSEAPEPRHTARETLRKVDDWHPARNCKAPSRQTGPVHSPSRGMLSLQSYTRRQQSSRQPDRTLESLDYYSSASAPPYSESP